jgi:two-component system, NarL family, sensor histidine kinase UhpB
MFVKLPLLWQTFLVNAALFIVATLVLVFTPITVRTHTTLTETAVLTVGLILMLTANLLLLRRTFAPLGSLYRRMPNVDLLRPGQRLPETGGAEVSALVGAFNEMLLRLETERRQSASRAFQAQEAERLRVARSLHDEVGQVLTGVLLQFDGAVAELPPARQSEMEDARQTVRQALEEVRRIAQELRPGLLEHLGLVSALTEISTRMSRQAGFELDHQFGNELFEISEESEITVYRVVQESLTNVARHAKASHVTISLENGAATIVLRVVDNGCGFDDDPTRQHAGGLRGMRERAVLVGGVLAIKAGPQGGTEVRLELPAQSRAAEAERLAAGERVAVAATA